MRLIDADELLRAMVKAKDFGELSARSAIRKVREAPTVDAIPVDWLKKYVLIEGAYMSDAKRKEREIAKKLLKEYHESQRMEI